VSVAVAVAAPVGVPVGVEGAVARAVALAPGVAVPARHAAESDGVDPRAVERPLLGHRVEDGGGPGGVDRPQGAVPPGGDVRHHPEGQGGRDGGEARVQRAGQRAPPLRRGPPGRRRDHLAHRQGAGSRRAELEQPPPIEPVETSPHPITSRSPSASVTAPDRSAPLVPAVPRAPASAVQPTPAAARLNTNIHGSDPQNHTQSCATSNVQADASLPVPGRFNRDQAGGKVVIEESDLPG
jgi:hypothetical protein